MLFGTPAFLFIFLPLALGSFMLAARMFGPGATLAVLLGADVLFYGMGNAADCLLLAISILGNWWILPKVSRRLWFIAAVVANLAVLALFKYGTMLSQSVGLPPPALALPIGISFFTFQQIM